VEENEYINRFFTGSRRIKHHTCVEDAHIEVTEVPFTRGYRRLKEEIKKERLIITEF
jgi:hypothetical protein